jgi:hypothetical protein
VNERVRNALLGLGIGLGALLLLDLAAILADTVGSGATSVWWPIACYLAVGAIVATGVSAGRRDRLVPAVAALVVLLIALPAVPSGAASWIPELPLVPSTSTAQAVAFAAVGALTLGALRAGRA